MITTGAISISKMILGNLLLQELNMSDNNIGDSGISAIVEAPGNCRIKLLDVRRCNITHHGAASLAAALSSNLSIRMLYLNGNAITAEGALLMIKAAVDNPVCLDVWIDDEYKNDEVKKMISVLEDQMIQYVRDCVV